MQSNYTRTHAQREGLSRRLPEHAVSGPGEHLGSGLRVIQQEAFGGPEVLRLAEAAKAHEIGERGRTRGKIVLDV